MAKRKSDDDDLRGVIRDAFLTGDDRTACTLLKELGPNDSDDKFDVGSRMIRTWYFDAIIRIVDQAIKEVVNIETLTTTEARNEWLVNDIDQTTDGHEYVIYPAKAWMVLAVSEHSDEHEMIHGVPFSEQNLSAAACLTMRADVWELLVHRASEWQLDEDEW